MLVLGSQPLPMELLIFPQLFLLDMLDNLVGIMELQPLGLALEMHYLAVRLPGWF